MGICIVLAKENNTSPGCINFLHERHLLQPKKLSIFKSMHGWNSVRLLIYTRILLFQSPESCPFVTEKQKCCRLPFVYNNRTYTACTADVPDKDWKEQWSSPWCFPETPEKDRKETVSWEPRSSVSLQSYKFFCLKTIIDSTYNWKIIGTEFTKKLVCPFFFCVSR